MPIETAHGDDAKARNLPNVSGHRETSFGHLDLFLHALDLGVHDNRRFVNVVLNVDDEESLRDVDLRSGKPDPRRVIHGDEHVVDQLLEERIGEFLGIHLLGDSAQRWVAVGDDLTLIGHRPLFYSEAPACSTSDVGPLGNYCVENEPIGAVAEQFVNESFQKTVNEVAPISGGTVTT